MKNDVRKDFAEFTGRHARKGVFLRILRAF